MLDMGFTKNTSEKALFLNENNLEAAIEWVGQHQDDPDIDEEYKLEVKEKERLVEEYFFNLIKVNRKNGSRRNSQGG